MQTRIVLIKHGKKHGQLPNSIHGLTATNQFQFSIQQKEYVDILEVSFKCW